jgi:hypothetical protein
VATIWSVTGPEEPEQETEDPLARLVHLAMLALVIAEIVVYIDMADHDDTLRHRLKRSVNAVRSWGRRVILAPIIAKREAPFLTFEAWEAMNFERP